MADRAAKDRAATGRRGGPAIGAMCAGVLLLVLNDAAAKDLVARYSPMQVLFVRSLVALPLVAALTLWRRGPGGLRSARLRVHVGRGILAVAATCLFFASLRSLPLADATALIFAAPIFVAALSAPVLGEPVGPRRAAAILAGFAGVLLIARPGVTAVTGGALLALGAAAANALVMISARWIDRRDGFWTMTLYMTAVSATLSAFVLATDWPAPRGLDGALFAAMALAGTLGIGLISHAFRTAPAAVVAPFDYTAIVWASGVGWAVWGTVPTAWVLAGAAVIAASGIYLILSDAT